MNLNVTVLGQTIAFVLFVMFCTKYIWPPIIGVIEKRQKEVAECIASAERAKKDLVLAQEIATNQLKKAKEEARIIIEQANELRAQILEKVKSEAKQEYNRTIAQAQVKIEDDRKRVREELRKQIAVLVVAGAEKIIERSIDESTSSDIIDKLIADL